MGRGHNIARLNTRAPRSLQHAARLETSWPGQSGYTAVVSICEYTVSNKRGLPCPCLGDCGGYAPTPYILRGQLPPLPARFRHLCLVNTQVAIITCIAAVRVWCLSFVAEFREVCANSRETSDILV